MINRKTFCKSGPRSLGALLVNHGIAADMKARSEPREWKQHNPNAVPLASAAEVNVSAERQGNRMGLTKIIISIFYTPGSKDPRG